MDLITKESAQLSKNASLQSCEDSVDALLEFLEQAKANVTDKQHMAQVHTLYTSQVAPQITQTPNDVHKAISRYGKALDRTFKLNVNSAASSIVQIASDNDDSKEAVESREELNRAVAVHLLRLGEFDTANIFLGESATKLPPLLVEQFELLYDILRSMGERNLQPAIDWASTHQRFLDCRGSDLEFQLRELQFKMLLSQRDTSAALAYARTHFQRYQRHYLKEISQLVTSILYSYTGNSPYERTTGGGGGGEASTEDHAVALKTVQQTLIKEFCTLLGLSSESPLVQAVSSGTVALPILAKMGGIMKTKRTEWTSSNELPVEIDLPPEFQFHSVFVCPVSKEQTTDSNPPLMLPCGHILAHDTLKAMSKESDRYRFKCHYCPEETTFPHTRRVYF